MPSESMKIVKLIALLLLFLPLSHASDIGVRAQSFGGAIRAQASSNDVIFYNPAGMLKYRRIGTEIDYLQNSSAHSHRIGASIIDSQTSAWALGLAYSGLLRPQNQKAAHKAYLSLAMPIVTDMFALGGSVHYCYDETIGPSPYANYFNFDVGFLTNLPYGISFAVVADNLSKAKGNEKGLGLSVATAFDLGKIISDAPLSLSFDWLMDDVQSDEDLTHVIGAGMQYLMLNILPLRLGFKSSLADGTKLLSLGSGILTQSFSLDGLYQQDLLMGKNRYFGVAMRMSL